MLNDINQVSETKKPLNGKKEADNVKVILDKAINTFAEDVSSATKNNDW